MRLDSGRRIAIAQQDAQLDVVGERPLGQVSARDQRPLTVSNDCLGVKRTSLRWPLVCGSWFEAPSTIASPEIETPVPRPRKSRVAPSEAVSSAVWVPSFQPDAGLTKTYAAPCWSLAPTLWLGALATIVSPEIPTALPSPSLVAPFVAVSVRVRPAGRGLHEHVRGAGARRGADLVVGRAGDDRVARNGDCSEGVGRVDVGERELGGSGSRSPSRRLASRT
jgi:hypothetical protein